MKIFGFLANDEKKFVNITCNIILVFTLMFVLAFSVFSPIATEAYSNGQQAIYHGNTNSNKMCLMINVYWGDEFLDSMLETLKQNDVKTTFFVGGCWVAKNNAMLQKIVDGGHELANHGYFHKDHAKISVEAGKEEIYMTHELVKNLTNVEMNLFAPPSGSVNEKVVNCATSLGYKTIMWTRDTIDWRDKNANLVFSRATQNAKGGDLVLMHPTKHTAEALGDIIATLKGKGFFLTTVSDVVAE